MKIVEIFCSIEGEGKRAGIPCTFIRLAGCNLRCSYCDTKYSYGCDTDKEMSVNQILTAVAAHGVKAATVTGGEPLAHEGIEELLDALCKHGYYVNVETNGSIPIRGKINRLKYPYAFFTIDYKSISSGMNDKMHKDNFRLARSCDVVKFVVGSKEDLIDALSLIKNETISAQVYFSPVWGRIEMDEIVEFMKENPELHNCKLQVQLHKIIWDPETKGV